MDFPGKEDEKFNRELDGQIWLAKSSVSQYACIK